MTATITVISILAVLGFAGLWLNRYGMYCKLKQSSAADVERDRIADDFHDNLAHGLTGAALHLEMAMADVPRGPAYDSLQQAQRILRTTILDARHTLNRLRPLQLERAPFVDAVREMVRQLTKGLSATAGVRVEGVPRDLGREREDHLFRIVQEAVTNSLRHASAASIEVLLQFHGDVLVTTIRDESGEAVESADAKRGATGSGIASMRRRAEEIGAQLEVRATPGGQAIVVKLPL